MRKISYLTGLFILLSSAVASAAEHTWTGKISDSMCGASHAKMSHDGKKVNDRDCTLACVKGGGKYVFVSKGKVYELTNQDFAGLPDHAGHTVKLTGDLTSDGKITVSNIVMPGKKKAT